MFKSILVATDGSSHARKAVHLAADIARLYGAQLSIVHVTTGAQVSAELQRMAEVEHLVEPRPRSTAPSANIPAQIGSALADSTLHRAIGNVAEVIGQRILDDAVHAARETGVEGPRAHLERGDPVERVLDCIAREKADLVVVGSRGLSDWQGALLGSVSGRISHAADCTCITVK